jgi:hypothetical protein
VEAQNLKKNKNSGVKVSFGEHFIKKKKKKKIINFKDNFEILEEN